MKLSSIYLMQPLFATGLYADVQSLHSLIHRQEFWYLVLLLVILLLLIAYQFHLLQHNKQLQKEVSLKSVELTNQNLQLLQKMRMAAMGEMLSMIAHQWRQPLGAINSAIMSIDVKLAKGKYDFSKQDDIDEFLANLKNKHSKINEYVQYLSETTDDFRNFFNPKKEKELISITKPIQNALHILKAPLEEKGIQIIENFESNSQHLLYQNEIMQVIINMLRNCEENFAIRDTKNPTITIRTTTNNQEHGITICDNGGGINEDILAKVFEPYFSTKDEKNASGLGLYISKVMIEEHHNGKLDVDNVADGVCFYLKFHFPM